MLGSLKRRAIELSSWGHFNSKEELMKLGLKLSRSCFTSVDFSDEVIQLLNSAHVLAAHQEIC
jgi:hypothetical protein